MNVIGVDLGGTKVSAAIFNEDGEIIDKKVNKLEGRTGSDVGALIIETISDLIIFSKSKEIQIYAIGICVPGISYSKTGKVWAPNIPGWDNYPLLEEVKSVVEDKIVVTIESDRSCYILGETWKGVANGCKDAIFMAVGTGIGAGIMVNGEILRGSNDIAGAIGWLALDRPFEEKYISCGCFEYHASGEGLSKVANEYSKDFESTNPEELKSAALFTKYEENDPLSKKVIGEAIEYWGMAVANLVSLFNPEKVIFGGGVFGPAQKFLDEILEEAKKWAQPISIKQVELSGSKLGSDAGLYGAGNVAIRSISH